MCWACLFIVLDPLQDGDEVDYKKAAGFQQHMKKTEAISHFSKSKTMAEQREFLPIYQVKEDLLRVIRDNQVGKVYVCLCACRLLFIIEISFCCSVYSWLHFCVFRSAFVLFLSRILL